MLCYAPSRGQNFNCLHQYRHLKTSNVEMEIEFRTTWTLFLVFLFYALVLALQYIIEFITQDSSLDTQITHTVFAVGSCIYILRYR